MFYSRCIVAIQQKSFQEAIMKFETPSHLRRHSDYGVLIQRHSENPILTTTDWPYPVNSVFNPGAVRMGPGNEILLMARVEDRRGISHLCAARSKDGVGDWIIDPQPTLVPDPINHPDEIWGIEDARVVHLPTLGRYGITYTAFSQGGPGVALAMTKDFESFERFGMILPPEDKDAALFPRQFDDHWAMIHRPVGSSGNHHIWISFSPDLKHWGRFQVLIPAREGAWWDARKVGLSPPPIETEEGWLIIYHGVRTTASGSLYRLGLALLDLDDPTRVIYRGDEWIFGPIEIYERLGDVGEVVFPCGAVVMDDGETLNIYYGGADTCICLATARISELLEWLKHHHYEGLV